MAEGNIINLITIIVPVYNTPVSSMERLFSSLKNQSKKEFDLLVMDDGSEEECASYLESLSKDFTSFRVEHNRHIGVSANRNAGLKLVSTPFVAFSDADDFYSPDFILQAEEYIKKYDVDVIYGVMDHEPKMDIKQSGEKEEFFGSPEEIYSLRQSLLDIQPRKIPYQVLGTPCGRVYRTEIAREVGFREEIHYFEDQIFNREYLKRVKKALVVPEIWYVYYQNDFSAMRKEMYKGFYEKTISYWDEFYRLNSEEPEKFRLSLRKKQLDFFYAVVNIDYIDGKKAVGKQAKKEIAEIAAHPMIKDAIEGINPKDPKVSEAGFGKSDLYQLSLLKKGRFGLLIFEKKIVRFFHAGRGL